MRRSSLDLPDEYRGCAHPCWNDGLAHTYAWGSCALAEQPPRPDPEIGWWRSTPSADGGSSLALAKIPFLTLFPWAKYLPLDERHQMMADLADAKDPEQTLKEWRCTADVWMDVTTLEALTRDRGMDEFVDAPRPTQSAADLKAGEDVSDDLELRWYPGFHPYRATKDTTCTISSQYGGVEVAVIEQEGGGRFVCITQYPFGPFDSSVHKASYWLLSRDEYWDLSTCPAGESLIGMAERIIEGVEPDVTLFVHHLRIVQDMPTNWAMYPPSDAWPEGWEPPRWQDIPWKGEKG